MHKILLTLTALLLALPLSLAAKDGAKTKVACVGNSVTFGYGLPHRATATARTTHYRNIRRPSTSLPTSWSSTSV